MQNISWAKIKPAYLLLAVGVFSIAVCIVLWRTVSQHGIARTSITAAKKLPETDSLMRAVISKHYKRASYGAANVKVSWVSEGWGYGQIDECLTFIARKQNGTWKVIKEKETYCGSTSDVKKYDIPNSITKKLIDADWFHPEYDNLMRDLLAASPKGCYIRVDWIKNGWALGVDGDSGGCEGFIARKLSGKWKFIDKAQDYRPTSDIEKYHIPSDVAERLTHDRWFVPEVEYPRNMAEREVKRSGALSGNLQIISWNWHKDSKFGGDGALIAVGQIKNIGSTTAEFVKVTVTYTNKKGEIVDTDSGYTEPENIPSGCKAPFKIYSDYNASADKGEAQVSCN